MSEYKSSHKPKPLSECTLLDDYFMIAVLKDNIEGIQEMLRIVLEKPDLMVENSSVQEIMKNLKGRSLVMDVVARDSQGNRYNIEVQNDSAGAIPKRARYHMALLDADSLEAGQGLEDLPENYVIFLTRSDVLGANKPIYHIERVVMETDTLFAEASHIIYVNCSWKLGAKSTEMQTPLEQLISDMRCAEPAKMNIKALASSAHNFKSEPEGATIMIDEYYQEGVRHGLEQGREEGRAEGIAEGREEGRAEERKEISDKLRAKGMSQEEIDVLLK